MKKIVLICSILFVSLATNSMTIRNNSTSNSTSNNTINEVKRVRINFISPTGFIRPLLLGFTPDNVATDGFDFGYDTPNIYDFPNDLNWLIEGDRYVIQGVGAFNEIKRYPFGMFLTDAGNIEISLTALENFDTPINVYIYDALLDTYTQINDSNYAVDLASGDYLNRFYIAFLNANEALLSSNESELQNTKIIYLSNTKELYINTFGQNNVKQIDIYNLLGQKLSSITNIHSTKTKIPVNAFATNYVIVNIETDYGFLSKKIIIH